MTIEYKNKKFLVVDDFKEFRSSVRGMLVSFGALTIDGANSADSAISMIKTKPYDVILCDYNLGHNQKDGQQILEEVKYRELIKLSTVFIMVTAENTMDMIMGAVEYAPDDYLIKPFAKDVLRTRIEKAIKKKADLERIESAVRNKEYRHAIELCEEQIENNPPNLFEYMKLKGELCLSIGDYDRASDLYEMVLEMRDIPWAKIGLGRVSFSQGNYSEAQRIFRSLVQDNKMLVVAYDWLAKTLVKIGEPEEAQSILQDALNISPKSINRQKHLGEIALETKDFEVSEKAFKSAIEVGRHSYLKNPTVYTGLAKAFLGQNEPEKAIPVLSDINKDFRESPEAAFQSATMKGVVYQTMKKTKESKEYFKEAHELFKTSGKNIPEEVIVDLAKSCLDVGEKESGLELLKEVIRNNHEDEVLLQKVQTIFNDADLSEEGKHLISATQKEIIQINNQGVKLVEEGKLSEAMECFEKAAASLSGNKIILANTAQTILMVMQKTSKDRALLRKAKGYLTSLQRIDPHYKKIPSLLEMHENLLRSMDHTD
jgi:tetratricopeptide (TPR) repeat protein